MIKQGTCFFTSESVSKGHPDKVCDQISDAILDEILRKDKTARVACETYITRGLVIVGGEITTRTWVDVEQIARDVIKDIGYDNAVWSHPGPWSAHLQLKYRAIRQVPWQSSHVGTSRRKIERDIPLFVFPRRQSPPFPTILRPLSWLVL